ncbi:MAG: hypothetical protein MJ211_11455 [Bacteroidales bacterium]|nr:hypothetical protein [Bacteroidales bacterium]
MKKTVTYNYSSSEITSKGRQLIQLVLNDMEYFSKFGVTEKEIETFKKRITDFENYPDDKIFAEDVSEKTKVKNEKEKDLKEYTRIFLLHLSIIIVGKQEMKKYFKTQKVTGIPIKELIDLADKVLNVAKKFKTKLSVVGLKSEEFDKYKDIIKSTRDASKELEVSRAERVKHTNKRRDLGRILYEKMVKFSALGKNIWKDKNEENYKRYLLYSEIYKKNKEKKESITKNKSKDQ